LAISPSYSSALPRTADTDRDGNISYKEFIEILQDPDAIDKDADVEVEESEVAEDTPGALTSV
jgi:Ca2+-binding EF-hand superfamily protein